MQRRGYNKAFGLRPHHNTRGASIGPRSCSGHVTGLGWPIDAAYLVSSPYICMESVMDQFLRRENVERFRLLAEEIIADETERERTLKLLAEERQKQKDAGNPAEAD
jgi:hypothetical protein